MMGWVDFYFWCCNPDLPFPVLQCSWWQWRIDWSDAHGDKWTGGRFLYMDIDFQFGRAFISFQIDWHFCIHTWRCFNVPDILSGQRNSTTTTVPTTTTQKPVTTTTTQKPDTTTTTQKPDTTTTTSSTAAFEHYLATSVKIFAIFGLTIFLPKH